MVAGAIFHICRMQGGPDCENQTSRRRDGLNAAELESIDLLTNLASAIGLPRSVAEIYGLLFVSSTPLALEDFCLRLEISKGSASQGLRLLRDLGAVHPVENPGGRRTLYRAETSLKALFSGFLHEQILPRLDGWPDRVALLEQSAATLPEPQRSKVLERVQLLKNWGSRAKKILPLITTIFQK